MIEGCGHCGRVWEGKINFMRLFQLQHSKFDRMQYIFGGIYIGQLGPQDFLLSESKGRRHDSGTSEDMC
jgi:hypothetical protein